MACSLVKSSLLILRTTMSYYHLFSDLLRKCNWTFAAPKLVMDIFQGTFQTEGKVDTVIEAYIILWCLQCVIKRNMP